MAITSDDMRGDLYKLVFDTVAADIKDKQHTPARNIEDWLTGENSRTIIEGGENKEDYPIITFSTSQITEYMPEGFTGNIAVAKFTNTIIVHHWRAIEMVQLSDEVKKILRRAKKDFKTKNVIFRRPFFRDVDTGMVRRGDLPVHFQITNYNYMVGDIIG